MFINVRLLGCYISIEHSLMVRHGIHKIYKQLYCKGLLSALLEIKQHKMVNQSHYRPGVAQRVPGS